MADVTSTTAATYVPAVWSTKTSVIYAAKRVCEPLLDHRWEPAVVGGGDRVNIPQFTQTAASGATARSTFGTGASITFSAVTESQTVLQVTIMAYRAYRIPVEISPQLYANYERLLYEDAGQAVARYQDNIIAANDTNGFDAFTAVGTDNADVTEDLVLDVITVLNNAEAPQEDRYAVISPATYQSMCKIEALRNSQWQGATGQFKTGKATGFIASAYMLDWYMSTNLESGTSGKKNFIGQREAIAIATQKKVSWVKATNIADGGFDEVMAYLTFGIKQVKAGFGRELDGK